MAARYSARMSARPKIAPMTTATLCTPTAASTT